MVSLRDFLVSPCFWRGFMIIEKGQCFYNSNLAFGNGHETLVIVISYQQSGFLWFLLWFTVFSITSKRGTRSLESTYTSLSNDSSLLPFLETSSLISGYWLRCFCRRLQVEGCWVPWTASSRWSPAPLASPRWSSWRRGSCEPPSLPHDVLSSLRMWGDTGALDDSKLRSQYED